MKYDIPLLPPPVMAETLTNPVLMFGSTREGEEDVLAPVVQELRTLWPGLRVIWAPRHIERVPQIEKDLLSRNWASERRSVCGPQTETPANLIWDTFGNLMEAYHLADVAVIGGSYVGKGGQNPLEPAALGKPVVFGPSMENFHDIAQALTDAGGARQVPLDQLAITLRILFQQPVERQRMVRQAQTVLTRASGATDRTLTLLERGR